APWYVDWKRAVPARGTGAGYRAVPLRGSGTPPSVSEIRRRIDGTADAWKVGPEVDESTLRQATPWRARSSPCSSPHSVEPVSVHSSASQLPNTTVRRGG